MCPAIYASFEPPAVRAHLNTHTGFIQNHVWEVSTQFLSLIPGAHNEKERPTQYICSIPTYDQNPLKFLSGKVHVWKSKPSPYLTRHTTLVTVKITVVRYRSYVWVCAQQNGCSRSQEETRRAKEVATS